jgi:hypothetical protein
MTLNNVPHSSDELKKYFRTYPKDELNIKVKNILKQKKFEVANMGNYRYGAGAKAEDSLFKQVDRIHLISRIMERYFNPEYLVQKGLL